MRWLSTLLLLAQPADVALTWACMAQGGVEVNPMLSPWLDSPESFGALLALKIAWPLVALLALSLAETRAGRPSRWARSCLWILTGCCWIIVMRTGYQIACCVAP